MEYIDMLAKFGVGSAHPGGFSATINQFQEYPLPPNSRILEVGCGTGKTACYLAGQGHIVTAVDLHETMINKAKKRAEISKVPVEFIKGDVCNLPFDNEQFDIIIVESVTNFTNAESALSECYRVLRQGGTLYDRELIVHDSIPSDKLQEMKHFFRMPQIMNRREWLDLLRKQKFNNYELLEYDAVDPKITKQEALNNDFMDLIDEGTLLNVSVWQTLFRHDDIIYNNLEYLLYGLIKATK